MPRPDFNINAKLIEAAPEMAAILYDIFVVQQFMRENYPEWKDVLTKAGLLP